MIRASKAGLTVCGVLYRQAMTTTEDMDTVEVLSLRGEKLNYKSVAKEI